MADPSVGSYPGRKKWEPYYAATTDQRAYHHQQHHQQQQQQQQSYPSSNHHQASYPSSHPHQSVYPPSAQQTTTTTTPYPPPPPAASPSYSTSTTQAPTPSYPPAYPLYGSSSVSPLQLQQLQSPPPPQAYAAPTLPPPPAGAVSAHPFYPSEAPSSTYGYPMHAYHHSEYGGGSSPSTHPDATQEHQAQDALQFNALPHFVRPSVSRLPNSASVKQKIHVPLGVVVQPLAPPPPGTPEVPSVNFGNSMVVRCKRCRSYINPFSTWEANGRRWNCNMCNYVNDTPQFYYKPLDQSGKREDRFERAELCTGSVEFIAPADYMVRPPQAPTYMFVIDVSLAAVSSGMVDAACQGIKTALLSGGICGGSRGMVGVLTFDTTIHFYNLNPSLSQPQVVVVADLEEVFIPLPDYILVNFTEAKAAVEALLDALPGMWRGNRVNESCLGSAIRAGYLSMRHIGGKLMLFAATPPTIGEFQVKLNRESMPQASSTRGGGEVSDKCMELLKPATEDYKSFAEHLTKAQISAELFLCPLNAMDVATISPLAKFTSGEVHYYPQFNLHLHGEKMKQEIVHSLTRTTGWEAVMRFRVSRGWRITNWYGHFYFRAADLLVIPSCHADQIYSITLEMEENVAQDPLAYLQGALLYTNSDGERRIRVHSYCLPVTQHFADIANSMDVQATSVLLAQQAMQMAIKSKLSDGRSYLQSMCSQVLTATSQISPDISKLLPLYVLGMLKSLAFRDSKDVTPDQRVYHWMRLDTIPVATQAAYFYPRLLALHDADSQQIPDALNLTAEKMTQDGAYLVEDGESMLMWIGRALSSKWLEGVFGIQSIEQLHPDYAESAIGNTGSVLGQRIQSILQAVRDFREPPYMKLTVIRQGDPNEHKFFAYLVEDKTHALMLTYPEFLNKLGAPAWRMGRSM